MNLIRLQTLLCPLQLQPMSISRHLIDAREMKAGNWLRFSVCLNLIWVHAVAQLVEALRYKPEGRGFDSRWCHWSFSLTSFRTMALGSTQPLTEMSTRNISWGKCGRCVGLTTLPPSCADCLEIWEPHPPGTLRACPGL